MSDQNSTNAADKPKAARKPRAPSANRSGQQQQQLQAMPSSSPKLAGGGVQLQADDLAIVQNAWGVLNGVFTKYGIATA